MMDFIEGIALHGTNLGERLPPHAQDIVFDKVSEQIRYLRSLPSEGYYGRCHEQAWSDPPPAIRLSHDHKPVGPFRTYEDFVSTMYLSHEIWASTVREGSEWHAGFEADTRKLWSSWAEREPTEPKFTWIDSKLANIIAQPVRKEDGTEDWDVVLIDWECAGWYPAWVQASQLNLRFHSTTFNKETHEIKAYRRDEICPRILKGFDSNLDLEKEAIIRQQDYRFF
jgi:hypothetical protein